MTKRQHHNVQPIKDTNVLKQVQDTLLNNFKAGRRNLTIFQLGKATLLRVSDVLSLEYSDVFTESGSVKSKAYTRDKKTGKANTLYLDPVANELVQYHQWLSENSIKSKWLFPSLPNPKQHIDSGQYYKIMAKVGVLLNITYLGTHTMRKTGAYRVYEQTNYNIGFVMDLLNHSDQQSTLRYLGIDEVTKENMLNQINFG